MLSALDFLDLILKITNTAMSKCRSKEVLTHSDTFRPTKFELFAYDFPIRTVMILIIKKIVVSKKLILVQLCLI